MNLSENLDIELQSVVTGRGCIIGQSGSGKSFLAGVMTEELCRLGVPFCVIDTEGEYSSLKGKFNVMIVGGDHKDVDLDVDFSKLFRASIANNIPVILDVSDSMESKEIVYSALQLLYQIEDKIRKPYLVLVEEADKFIPQVLSKDPNIIQEISVRGRKRGIGLLIATQRPANVNKNVLAQCSYGFIGKLTIENDLAAIKILFDNKEKLEQITKLTPGEFMPFGVGQDQSFQVKPRIAKHMGLTPSIELYKSKGNKVSTIVDELRGTQSKVEKKPQERQNMQHIFAIPISLTAQEVKESIQKKARKEFLFFGDSVEKMEEIEQLYVPIALCAIRLQTGKKNEYLEYYAMLNSKCELLKLDRAILSIKNPSGKLIKLSNLENQILSYVELHNPININQLYDAVEADDAKIETALLKLEKNNLLSRNNGRASTTNYIKYLEETEPVLEKIDASDVQILSENITEKDAKSFINSFFPGAQITNFKLIHIPIYRATLRDGNKVRVFTVDAIYGKELNL